MRELDIFDAKHDGYNYRPALYNLRTGKFNSDEFKRRRERMNNLCDEYKGFLFVSILASEIDLFQYTSIDPLTRENYRVWFCQVPLLLDYDVLAFCGRDIGKTTTVLQTRVIHNALNFPGGSLLYTAFDQPHVNPRMVDIFAKIDGNPLFKFFLDKHIGARSGRHPFKQRFANGHVVLGIAAGEHSSKGVESPHVMALVADEFQHYSKVAWDKLGPAINDQESNRKHGTMRVLVGVNSEGRSDNVYSDLAFNPVSEFRSHVYQFASWLNPLNYTLTKHKEYLGKYGNSVNTSEFKQMIRGLVGTRAKGVIPEDLFDQAVDFGKKMQLDSRVCNLSKQLWENKSGNFYDILGSRFLDHPGTDCIISADYGSVAPTEIGLWFRMKEPQSDEEKWALWGRIALVRVDPAIQARIMDELDTLYSPLFISIDSTAATNPLTAILKNPYDNNYNEKGYDKRVYEAKFNGDATVRYELYKPEDAGREYKKHLTPDGNELWAVKAPANEFATDLIVKYLYEKMFAFPDDTSLRRDCLGMTEINTGKQRQYKGTPMHIVSMLRAFTLVHHKFYTLQELEAQVLQDTGEDEGVIWTDSISLV